MRKHLKTHLKENSELIKYLYKSQSQKTETNQLNPIAKPKFDDAVINCIIEDARAFGDFRKPGMMKFLKLALPGYKPPSRQMVERRVWAKYCSYRQEIAGILKDVDHIALTVDMWKNKALTYFLGLTAHFFDKTMSYVSIVIGFREFEEQHLSKRLKAFIQNELDRLGISKRIISITSDNGADIKSAVATDFGVPISCFCHNLNLVVKPLVHSKTYAYLNASLCNTKLFLKPFYNLRERNQELSDTLEIEDYETSTSDDDDESVDEDNEWVEDHGNNSDGDYNDTDDSEDENDGEGQGNGAVRDAFEFLKKTRCLVGMVRKSGIVSGFVTKRIKALETNPGGNFILDFHVRWNSTYLMLKRLKKLKCIADEITNNPDAIFGLKAKQRTKLESLHLSNEEWIMCDILLNILHPFLKLQKCYQAEITQL